MSEKWQIATSASGDVRLIVEDADNNKTICAMSLRGCEGRVYEMTRRANLIAAAPEMLAELKKSRIDLAYIKKNGESLLPLDYWLDEMDRVIALAEGNGGAL